MYETPRVNVKGERGSTFMYTRDLVTFHTLSLFYLRAYARKNCATEEIHLKEPNSTRHSLLNKFLQILETNFRLLSSPALKVLEN